MTEDDCKIIQWNAIREESIPESQGIYAWYYCPHVSGPDAKKIIEFLKDNEQSSKDRKDAATKFLDDFYFIAFKQEPYDIKVSGKLMPAYEGTAEHVDQASSSLVKKILNDPEKIEEIRTAVNSLPHSFLSPIYIGMAGNLRVRIEKHKNLIKKYKGGDYKGKIEDDDHVFASRVASRGMRETHLSLAIKPIKGQEVQTQIENLLNRISYPLLGRN
jgi:hypothetical protein